MRGEGARTKLKADFTLDCTGLMCPMPIANTAMKIKTMSQGQVLEVIADDPGIKRDMPAWARVTGNELLGMEEEEGKVKAYLRKG